MKVTWQAPWWATPAPSEQSGLSLALPGIALSRAGGAPECLYNFQPGDRFAAVHGLGLAVCHADGRTILFTAYGQPGHPAELDALRHVEWQAAP